MPVPHLVELGRNPSVAENRILTALLPINNTSLAAVNVQLRNFRNKTAGVFSSIYHDAINRLHLHPESNNNKCTGICLTFCKAVV